MALQSKTYSVGNFTKKGITNGYILDLILTEESTSITNNTSKISYVLQLRSGSSNRFNSSYFHCKVKVAGKEESANPKITAAYNHTYTLITGSVTVTHNADGGFEMPFSASMWNASENDYAPYDAELSGKMTLTAIPRASTISAADANIGARSTVVINRKSSSFTHSIAYKFGKLTGYINAEGTPVASEVKMTATTVNFAVPDSFYAQIPSAASGTCTLTCRTYSGSTQIGEDKTATFTATAAQSDCKPQVTGTVVDVNEATLALTGNEKVLIKYRSTARCVMNAQAKNSATIKTKTIAGKTVTGTELDIPNAEAAVISFQAVDSRGYTGSDTDEEITVVNYIPLSNLASVRRDDPTSGNATLTLEGSFWKGNFGTADNTLTVQYRINGADAVITEPELTFANGKYSGAIALTGLDYTSAHTVEVIVEDKLTRASKTLKVQKGIPVFDWGEGDFRFHVPVTGTAFNGVFMRTAYVWNGEKTITVQTRFSGPGDGGARQSLFLFGYDNTALLSGVIGVNSSGAVAWSGTEGVTIGTMNDTGQITVNLPNGAYDYFVLISAYQFQIM